MNKTMLTLAAVIWLAGVAVMVCGVLSRNLTIVFCGGIVAWSITWVLLGDDR
jgi:hypothetical protein